MRYCTIGPKAVCWRENNNKLQNKMVLSSGVATPSWIAACCT